MSIGRVFAALLLIVWTVLSPLYAIAGYTSFDLLESVTLAPEKGVVVTFGDDGEQWRVQRDGTIES